MEEYISILDKIRKKYIQLDVEKYTKISGFLKKIWECFKEIAGVKENVDDSLQIVEYLSFFDPKKVPATGLKIIEKLPTKRDIILENIIEEEYIEELIEFNIIYIIKRTEKTHIIITPEGLVFYFALRKSKRYENYYRLNTLLIQNFEKLILNKFRDFIFQKFSFMQAKEEGTVLNYLDIGIIFFFLINGSIDEERAFKREAINVERALNCVVYAFYKGKVFSSEEREDIKIRVLQSDLSLLQAKIGYIIYSEKKEFYVKSQDLPYLYDILKASIENKEAREIITRWEAFLEEYNYWRPILRHNNMCFYDRFEVEKLENEILKIKNH